MKENHKRGFKGVWIPKEIWLTHSLTLQEKVFLIEIDSLNNQEGCFASNSHFSSFFNLSKQRCSQVIKSLEEKKYITIEYVMDGREVERRIIKIRGIKYPRQGIKYPIEGGIKYPIGGIKESRKVVIQYNNKEELSNKIKEKIKRKRKVEPNKFWYIDEKFQKAFFKWLDYKKNEKNFQYKTEASTKTAYESLVQYADNNPKTAMEIVNHSIASGYAGLFPLAKSNNKQLPKSFYTEDRGGTLNMKRKKPIKL